MTEYPASTLLIDDCLGLEIQFDCLDDDLDEFSFTEAQENRLLVFAGDEILSVWGAQLIAAGRYRLWTIRARHLKSETRNPKSEIRNKPEMRMIETWSATLGGTSPCGKTRWSREQVRLPAPLPLGALEFPFPSAPDCSTARCFGFRVLNLFRVSSFGFRISSRYGNHSTWPIAQREQRGISPAPRPFGQISHRAVRNLD